MLNKQDTGALKGLAILCIAIHNFCHWLPMAVHENEYVFRLEDSFKLLHYVENFRPHVLLNVFSHFGHYGVPVFLFLSGYGLVCKYERSTPGGLMADAPSPALPAGAQFVRTHIVKLWQLMLPALLLFVITQFAFRGSFEKEWSWALRLVTFTANLFPTVNMILGPWWFFSPIFAVLGTVPWIQLLRRSNVLFTYAAALGGISAAVFAFHPIVRHYLIIPASDALKQHQYVQLYGVICLYLVLVLALALLYQAAMRRIHRKRGARS